MIKILGMSVVTLALVAGLWQASGTSVSYAATGCGDFSTQAAAQAYYRVHDTSALDVDGDGVACENVLPCPCDYVAYAYGAYVPNTYTPDPAVYLGGPAPSRTGLFSLALQSTQVQCNGEIGVVARVMYPDGSGAVAHLVTFQSSLGTTLLSTQLSDGGGYAQTKFVAPSSSGPVQITAFSDGMTRTAQVNVTCPQPTMPPPLGIVYILPPSTGDGGLVGSDNANNLTYWLAAFALLAVGAPAAAVAVVRQRR